MTTTPETRLQEKGIPEFAAAECELASALSSDSDSILYAMVDRLTQKKSGIMTHRAIFAAAKLGVLSELERRHASRKDHARGGTRT